VLDQIQILGGRVADWQSLESAGVVAVHSHDASRQQFRKGQSVLRSNFYISIFVARSMGQGIESTHSTRSKPAAEGNQRYRKVGLAQVVKPWNQYARLIDAGVQLDRSECRKRGMKARDVIERKPKNAEPINQSITGERAERQQLVEARGEPPVAERTIEVVRDVLTVSWNERPGRS
jgi:hypothetical protein